MIEKSKHYDLAIACGAKRGPKDSDLTFSPASLRDFLKALDQQEPVAEVKRMMTGANAGIATRIVEIDDPMRERLRPGDKLYTAPQPRQWRELTDEQADSIINGLRTCLHLDSKRMFLKTWLRDWAAHNIKGEASKTDRELMQQALEALESEHPEIQLRAAIALRERLAQPEQEPGAVYGVGIEVGEFIPPRREWVGLTEEEIMDRWPFESRVEFARWVEAKLREKNA